MKRNEAINKVVKIWIFLIVLISFGNTLAAQTEKTRTVEKTFDGKTALWASHRYGDLIMKKSNNNQIRAVLSLSAIGKNTDELDQFLNEFDLSGSEAPDNKVDIKTGADIQNWNTSFNKTTITLKNGHKYTGIQKFKMTLELYVPKLRYATLENKYDAIKVEEGTADILIVNLYDGNLEAPGKYDKLNLEMKYSKGKVGDFNASESDLYDSDLIMGDGQSLKMQSKYSEVKIGSLQTLDLDCYDDKYDIAGVRNSLSIKDKYSEFTFGDIGDATLDIYDGKVVTQNTGTVNVSNSKYTEFTFQEMNALNFTSSYDDDIKAAKLNTLKIDESKYTEYHIGALSKTLKIKSYNDEIDVKSVGADFEEFTIDGKYTNVTLPIPASVKYEINAYLKYGKLIFPDKELEAGVYKEKNDEITIQGKLKGAGSNAPKVSINSYDGTIRLN